MANPQRIVGIGTIPTNLDASLARTLQRIKNAVEQIQGKGSFGAVRYADINDLIDGRANGGASTPSTPTNLEDEPYFQDLRRVLNQAVEDIHQLFYTTSFGEGLATDNRTRVEVVAEDLDAQAGELADLADDLADQALDLLNLATDVDLLQTSVGDLEDDALATSTLLDATVSRVDANEASIDVITADITALQSEIVDTSSLDPGIMWQFEADDDDWTSSATLTTNTFYIRIGTGTSTYFRSPSGIAIDGRLFTRIVARIRRVSGTGWLGRASYATTGGGSHGIDTTNYHLTLASEPIFAGGGWVIVTWDMELLTAGGTDWVDSVIDQIQLELSDDNTTIYETDWVAIGRIAPSYVTSTVNALEARVTATEDGIEALSASITSLETSFDDLEGDVDLNTSAISALTTRIDAAEDDISILSASVTSLESSLSDAEDDIAALSTAVTGLETSVTSINGTLTTHASQLTSLDSRVDDAESDIASSASAITALETEVESIGDTVSAHALQLTSLDSRLDIAEGDIDANTSAISSLDTRVDSAESTLTAQSTALISLDTRLDSAEANLSGQASALSSLTTQVLSQGAQLSSVASSVTRLEVRGGEANLVNPLNAIGNLSGWTYTESLQVNTGGRNVVTARRRTNNNVQDFSDWYYIHPKGIYEVRVSALKSIAHGMMYFGMHASANGENNDLTVNRIVNRAIVATEANPYWAYNGAAHANHAAWPGDRWHDFIFYIAGNEVDPALIPRARLSISGNPTDFELWQWGTGWFIADGFQLRAGSQYARLRFLNYYNTVQADMYVTDVRVRRIDNQKTASLLDEATARAQADGTLSVERSIKVDVNGYIAGWGLLVSGGVSGPIQSSMNFLVDRFNIAMPGVAGPTAVFTVANINGVPSVGINGNLVVDGTIRSRNLARTAAPPHQKSRYTGTIGYPQMEPWYLGVFVPELGPGWDYFRADLWASFRVFVTNPFGFSIAPYAQLMFTRASPDGTVAYVQEEVAKINFNFVQLNSNSWAGWCAGGGGVVWPKASVNEGERLTAALYFTGMGGGFFQTELDATIMATFGANILQ